MVVFLSKSMTLNKVWEPLPDKFQPSMKHFVRFPTKYLKRNKKVILAVFAIFSFFNVLSKTENCTVIASLVNCMQYFPLICEEYEKIIDFSIFENSKLHRVGVHKLPIYRRQIWQKWCRNINTPKIMPNKLKLVSLLMYVVNVTTEFIYNSRFNETMSLLFRNLFLYEKEIYFGPKCI